MILEILQYQLKVHHTGFTLEKVSTSISVNWAVGGVCKVFASLLGRFGTELRIAALK